MKHQNPNSWNYFPFIWSHKNSKNIPSLSSTNHLSFDWDLRELGHLRDHQCYNRFVTWTPCFPRKACQSSFPSTPCQWNKYVSSTEQKTLNYLLWLGVVIITTPTDCCELSHCPLRLGYYWSLHILVKNSPSWRPYTNKRGKTASWERNTILISD